MKLVFVELGKSVTDRKTFAYFPLSGDGMPTKLISFDATITLLLLLNYIMVAESSTTSRFTTNFPMGEIGSVKS